ncbi:uncharacterized protein [Drosophila virilis]|uniref:Uncharacterized protein n=1 Tax=Drosophila virilis TaxID=7244 RepID=B4LUW8_DROVI|nr:uncharacterized protein LOC6627310 [Drosophila virilis]XP_032294184.1 uncharacterized protein LOC6627310 [Drosophila virilis]EDW64295.1 uncharacterized protein Dvir_GJ23321 [Drosophila virilis]
MELTATTSEPPGQVNDTALRLRTREYARQQRKDLRMDTTDALRFGLGQIKDKISELENLGIKDVQGMASRIKRRKHATEEDMYRLSHAFLQGNANINAFAEVQGATQVIVKELTGTHMQRQIEAAECLCNFSLGEAHVCEKITALAGSYLVTLLNSQEPRLKRSCLWTLGNILATCRKSANMLLQMQLATKLWKIYTLPSDDLRGYQEDAGICLYLIATHAASSISVDDRRHIAENLHKKQPAEPAAEYYMYIVFQLEIVSKERDLCAQHFQHLYDFFMANLNIGFNTSADKLRTVYGVRVLANMFAARPSVGQLELQLEQLVNVLNQLFALRDTSLTMDLMQLLKNLMDAQLLDNELVLEHLRVYA